MNTAIRMKKRPSCLGPEENKQTGPVCTPWPRGAILHRVISFSNHSLFPALDPTLPRVSRSSFLHEVFSTLTSTLTAQTETFPTLLKSEVCYVPPPGAFVLIDLLTHLFILSVSGHPLNTTHSSNRWCTSSLYCKHCFWY